MIARSNTVVVPTTRWGSVAEVGSVMVWADRLFTYGVLVLSILSSTLIVMALI